MRPSRVSLVVFSLVLLAAAVSADTVDSEPRAVPFFGSPSRTGCLAYINWSNQPPPTGTWSNGHVINSRCEEGPAGAVRGWIYTSASSEQTDIAGNPGGQTEGLKERIRTAFRNMKRIIRNYGANYDDVIKVFILTYNLTVMRPLVNAVQAEPEFWGAQVNYTRPKYPNRSIMGDSTFNGFDCLRVSDGVIYRGPAGAGGQVVCNHGDRDIGDVLEVNYQVAVEKGDGPAFPRDSNNGHGHGGDDDDDDDNGHH